MRVFYKGKDGGSESTVTGYWLIELKWLFSVVLLRFDPGSREVYHSHAFNALTWWISGEVVEYVCDSRNVITDVTWRPSFIPKYTPRRCCHKVYALRRTWALSFRGPWSQYWHEYDPKEDEITTLTNGRKIIQ